MMVSTFNSAINFSEGAGTHAITSIDSDGFGFTITVQIQLHLLNQVNSVVVKSQ